MTTPLDQNRPLKYSVIGYSEHISTLIVKLHVVFFLGKMLKHTSKCVRIEFFRCLRKYRKFSETLRQCSDIAGYEIIAPLLFIFTPSKKNDDYRKISLLKIKRLDKIVS